MQGDLISKPVPKEEVTALLRTAAIGQASTPGPGANRH
jgi:hypothetical protein